MSSNKINFLSKPELRKRVPYSESQVYRLEQQGKFPRRVKLGPNRVGWVESEIDEWARERLALRDEEISS